jgi:nucleotide-binding universal stress UspA family protein
MRLGLMLSGQGAFPQKQVEQACALARALDLPLTAIISGEDSVDYHPVAGGGYVAVIGEFAEIAEKNLLQTVEQFKSVCAKQKIAQEWFSTRGFIHHEWESLSPYFDLAITTHPFSAPEMATIGLTATLQLADTSQIGAFDERCVIAWDGSLRAGRAVRAALPLLPRFKEVSVLAVDARNRTLPLDIGSYLAANGVTANVVSLSSSGEKIGQLILEEARQASLLVMGAYGFPARLERLFGGVTETIRKECITPVLFAH